MIFAVFNEIDYGKIGFNWDGKYMTNNYFMIQLEHHKFKQIYSFHNLDQPCEQKQMKSIILWYLCEDWRSLFQWQVELRKCNAKDWMNDPELLRGTLVVIRCESSNSYQTDRS